MTSWLRPVARLIGPLAALLVGNTAGAASVMPDRVRCLLDYGGEQHEVIAAPLPDAQAAYDVAPTVIGSYFLFRIVFQTAPRRDASIKLYTYADLERGPLPLHQATYPYPPVPARGAHGFTGLQTVYEPVRDGELKYWCTVQPASTGARP